MYYDIKVGTITSAQRAVFILNKFGIKGTVGRLKNPSKADGCGYTVRVRDNYIDEAVRILKSNYVNISGVDKV